MKKLTLISLIFTIFFAPSAMAKSKKALKEELASAKIRVEVLENEVEVLSQSIIPQKVVIHAPILTVYFPEGIADLTPQDEALIKAAAYVMMHNGSKFEIIGYSDIYTEACDSERLRSQRASNVAAILDKCEVNTGSYVITDVDWQLNSDAPELAPLNLAVTITEIPVYPR